MFSDYVDVFLLNAPCSFFVYNISVETIKYILKSLFSRKLRPHFHWCVRWYRLSQVCKLLMSTVSGVLLIVFLGCGDTKTLITQHTPPGANMKPAVISRAIRHAKKFPPPRPAEKTPPSPRPVTPLGKIPKFFLRRSAPGYPSLIVTLKNLRGRAGVGVEWPRPAPRGPAGYLLEL